MLTLVRLNHGGGLDVNVNRKEEGTQDSLPLFPEPCITEKAKLNLKSIHGGQGVSEN